MNSTNSAHGYDLSSPDFDSLIRRAHTVLDNSSEVRNDLVSSIKERNSSGNYVIQVEQLGNRLLPILIGDQGI